MFRRYRSPEDENCFLATKSADGVDVGIAPFESAIINGRGASLCQRKKVKKRGYVKRVLFRLTSGPKYHVSFFMTGTKRHCHCLGQASKDSDIFLGCAIQHAHEILSAVTVPDVAISAAGRKYDNATGAAETEVPLETFVVRRGGRFRFRLISAAMSHPLRVSIDRHPLHVIATDGEREREREREREKERLRDRERR